MSPFDWKGPSVTGDKRVVRRGRPALYDAQERKQRHQAAALASYHRLNFAGKRGLTQQIRENT